MKEQTKIKRVIIRYYTWKRVKYIMWKTLQDKTEIRRDLEKAKTKRSQQSREKLMTFCRRQQDRSMDSVRQDNQSYIVEDNKDADGSMDSIRHREPIICTLTWSKD